jgi:hypothetical protein
MDNTTAIAIAAGLGIPALGLLYKFIPQRSSAPSGILKDADIDRLDARVKVYERLAVVESNQDHLGQGLEGLRQDNALIFSKIDGLKDLIIEQQKEKKS